MGWKRGGFQKTECFLAQKETSSRKYSGFNGTEAEGARHRLQMGNDLLAILRGVHLMEPRKETQHQYSCCITVYEMTMPNARGGAGADESTDR